MISLRTNERKVPADLWELVNRGAPDECWPYQGRPTTQGYGQIQVSGTRLSAHVVAFELTNGPVPAGHVVDHTCHNQDTNCAGGPCPHRLCCNPAHLEAVTGVANVRRSPYHNANKAECANGHPYDDANTIRRPEGHRRCRTCERERGRRRRRPGGPADQTGCPGNTDQKIDKQTAGLIA